MHLGKHLHGKEFWARHASHIKGKKVVAMSSDRHRRNCTGSVHNTLYTTAWPSYLYPTFFALRYAASGAVPRNLGWLKPNITKRVGICHL